MRLFGNAGSGSGEPYRSSAVSVNKHDEYLRWKRNQPATNTGPISRPKRATVASDAHVNGEPVRYNEAPVPRDTPAQARVKNRTGKTVAQTRPRRDPRGGIPRSWLNTYEPTSEEELEELIAKGLVKRLPRLKTVTGEKAGAPEGSEWGP